jgi:hypothetical protein
MTSDLKTGHTLVDPTVISKYSFIWPGVPKVEVVQLVERHIVWSPASWEVNVNFPSEGPLV